MKQRLTAVILASLMSMANGVEAARHGSPFDGRWRIDYSCAGATGLYADRCAAGDRDHLELNLVVRGRRVCGTGGATAQLENRVGGASVVGIARGRRAQVEWEAMGAHGRGQLVVRGTTLVFTLGEPTPDDNSGWSFPPAGTISLKRMGPARPVEANCSRDLPNP